MKMFKFGDSVKVKRYIKKFIYVVDEKSKGRVVSERIPSFKEEELVGRIIGCSYRKKGIYNHGSTYRTGSLWGFDDGYDSPYLVVKETFKVWKVQIGMMNKHLEAIEEDIELLDYEVELPTMYSRWTEEERKQMSEWMKRDAAYFPRDEKGRFVKENSI
jgi:hypothetical protein